MKTTVVKLEVIVAYSYEPSEIAASDDIITSLIDNLHNDVHSVVLDCGFRLLGVLDANPESRNGGLSYYDSYAITSDQGTMKLVINVRSANHSSKPNLQKKNQKRTEGLKKQFPDAENIALIDTYYQEHGWGAQYYIGKGNKYSDPVDSLDKLNVMLRGQLQKLKSMYL